MVPAGASGELGQECRRDTREIHSGFQGQVGWTDKGTVKGSGKCKRMGKEVKTRGKGERNRVGTLKSRLGHQAGIPARQGQETEGVLGAWDSDFKRVQLKLWALGWDSHWAG